MSVANSFNPTYASSFQALDLSNVYVLGQNGNLWLEHGLGDGVVESTPPPRELVDENVLAFQAIDANNVFVLGTNGNLWLEHSVNGKFGQIPPPREQVDGSVAAFQAINTGQVYVLGEDGNLWLESNVNGSFGQVPPPRKQVDGNVAAFAALPGDLFTCFVLGTDRNLWIEHSVEGDFGQVPPPREQIDGNVAAFQPIGYQDVFVLGTDQNLWHEHAGANGTFGQVPPPREQVDANVMAFQAFSPTVIFVLGSNGNLWNEYPVNGKFGAVPPPRLQWGTGIADFQIITPPPPGSPQGSEDIVSFALTTQGNLNFGDGGPLWDQNVRLPTGYGTARPKYMILTLVYAPPGTAGVSPTQVQSQVQYQNGSITGVTTTCSKSFKGGFSLTANVGTLVDSASVQFTASRTTTNSSQLQISTGQSTQITVKGPTVDGIDHDYDLFYILLGPIVALTADPQGHATFGIVNEPQDMSIHLLQVGMLKNPPTLPMDPALAALLTAAGLTQNDYDQILALDPFASGSTTIDGRRYIWQRSFPYQYLQNEAESNSVTLTVSQTNTTTNTVENDYSVTASASVGVQNIFKVSTSFNFEWTNTNSTSKSEQSSQSAQAVIAQPSANWNGSQEIGVYLDTVYNSFMFAYQL